MITFSEIIERIKAIEGITKDKEVADILGVSKNVLANWKVRNTIPYKTLINYCQKHGITLDYILIGRGKIYIDRDISRENLIEKMISLRNEIARMNRSERNNIKNILARIIDIINAMDDNPKK